MIFDWDGLLVDSMSSVAEAISATARHYGVDVSPEYVLDSYFQPREKYYKSIGVEGVDVDKLVKTHKENVVKYRKPVLLISGVEETLKYLKDKGIKLAIASTAANELIRSELNRLSINNYFDDDLIFGGDLDKDEKLRQLATKLAVPNENILYVGDLPTDMASAKYAGILSAGINQREAGQSRLRAENPNYLFKSITELKDLVK